jgi:hypothetical protein
MDERLRFVARLLDGEKMCGALIVLLPLYHLKRPVAEDAALKAGIKAERERKVLAAWRARARS